jgi:transcriptional regulator with XRE-family HTH domain
MPTPMLGHRITKAREDARLGKIDLTRRLAVRFHGPNPTYSQVEAIRKNLSRWEKGTKPSVDSLIAIAEETGKPLRYFVDGDEDEEEHGAMEHDLEFLAALKAWVNNCGIQV